MKIIIVSTAYPLRGGIAHFNALLAMHLKKRHDVETVTFKRQYPSFLFPGKSQEESAGSIDPEETVAAPQWIDSINPFNWISVAAKISAMKPDLLIFKYWLPFFGPCFGTIARLVKRNTGARVLFICDNIIPHERRIGDVAFTKYAFGASNYFIVQSKAVERELQQRFPGTAYRFVPHPVYENFGASISKQKAREALNLRAKNVLLFFGYVRRYKGLMTLIEALHLLKKSQTSGDSSLQSENGGADVQLLVVGEFYDDEQKYRQKVKELNLEDSVTFVSDYIPNEEVGKYFCAADVVVLPYRSATQSGIVQIAYNFDKPVIATDVGGLSEVVIDNRTGFIVPPENPEALAQSISRYFRENFEQPLSENVRMEKRKYSWETLVKNIEGLYAE